MTDKTGRARNDNADPDPHAHEHAVTGQSLPEPTLCEPPCSRT
jgi:hypothetical protein